MLKYRSCLLITMYISRLHFLYVLSYIGKTILTWTTSKVLWSSIYSFLHILDLKSLAYKEYSCVCDDVHMYH